MVFEVDDVDVPSLAGLGPRPTVPLGGFPVRKTTAVALSGALLAALPRRESLALLFANTNFVVKCGRLLPAMHADGVLIVNDGIGLSLAASLFHRTAFEENLNGTDFTPYLFARTQQPLRVFLVGGTRAVLQKANTYVQDRLGQVLVGSLDGYADLNDPAMIERIRQADADVVLVALGNPLQEEWILRHRHSVGAGVLIGVGGLFDFWAGEKPRAPRLFRKLHLEWLFRLSLEPGRLLRRYTVDFVGFMWLCYRQR